MYLFPLLLHSMEDCIWNIHKKCEEGKSYIVYHQTLIYRMFKFNKFLHPKIPNLNPSWLKIIELVQALSLSSKTQTETEPSTTSKKLKIKNIEVLDVENTSTTTKKGSSRSSKILREKKPLATLGKDKLDNYKSTDKSSRKNSLRHKRKATRRNYGNKKEDETSSERKEEGGIVGEHDSPLPSRVSATFKTETKTPRSKKDDAKGE